MAECMQVRSDEALPACLPAGDLPGAVLGTSASSLLLMHRRARPLAVRLNWAAPAEPAGTRSTPVASTAKFVLVLVFRQRAPQE